jgi:hypothetical protein
MIEPVSRQFSADCVEYPENVGMGRFRLIQYGEQRRLTPTEDADEQCAGHWFHVHGASSMSLPGRLALKGH